MLPTSGFARLGRERMAYQVLGEGPPDLVLTRGSFSNATKPDRRSALILATTSARFVLSEDYPIGVAGTLQPAQASLWVREGSA